MINIVFKEKKVERTIYGKAFSACRNCCKESGNVFLIIEWSGCGIRERDLTVCMEKKKSMMSEQSF